MANIGMTIIYKGKLYFHSIESTIIADREQKIFVAKGFVKNHAAFVEIGVGVVSALLAVYIYGRSSICLLYSYMPGKD